MTFGAYTVDRDLGAGRFGPVFRAHDADDVPVVIRTFAQSLSAEQRDRFMAALNALCDAPLEHPSIARPVACGLTEEGRPYVVHAYLAGTPLSAFTTAPDRRGIDDIVNRLTYLAGALDFAAAVGVVHGALTDADVIMSSESAGVSGLGLVQALELAGVAGFRARREEDIAALMAIARNLLGGLASPAVESLLSGAVPSSALAFAGALHRTIDADWVPAPAAAAEREPADAAGAQANSPDWLAPKADGLPNTAEKSAPSSDWPADGADWSADTTAADAASRFTDLNDVPPHPADEFVPEAADGRMFVREVADNHAFDVHLREDEDRRVAPGALPAPAMFNALPTEPLPVRRGSRSWVLIGVVALVLGVLTGFAGGLFVGGEIPALDPVGQTGTPESTEPTSGQTFTDAPIDEQAIAPRTEPPTAPPSAPQSPAVEPQASPPQSPSVAPAPPAASPTPERPTAAPPPGRTAARGTVPTPPSASGPAAIRVDSLPTGAQVFVDGRSVGYAPLIWHQAPTASACSCLAIGPG